eukprot:TRINITY_DN11698_c0_g1_i1.p1 TRINITY_DN11698_c0_g1~~TRINITY_DN11698_c0_g1_i1.p1  ORF type:complete len:702 (+),score=49.40 TRINITY_DN11698_c0_g1_i1:244-2106(+)
MKKVASILSTCFKINRRKPSIAPILGIGKGNSVLSGSEASKVIAEYYFKLFNQYETNSTKVDIRSYEPIEFDNNHWEKATTKLSRHKPVSWDEVPDEIIDIECFHIKLKNTVKQSLMDCKVPPYWKYGRLCLLSKEKGNLFPDIENTRPIIILCMMYKLLELYWVEGCIDIIWSFIGPHQTGFRKGASTHINIAKLKRYLKEARKGMVIFVDIKKAYDHVIRDKLYDLLSYIGIPSNYVMLYREMTSNMMIITDDNCRIAYNNGVPQGSCISPVLFNLYYEQALRQLTPYSDLILGFADDLSIVKNDVEKLPVIVNILSKWDMEFNLKVHERKTEIMLIHMEKPIYINYPICDRYKYLGVEVTTEKRSLTKKHIIRRIKNVANKMKWLYIQNVNIKTSKLAITWWLVSKILYNHITDAYLGFIKIEELEKEILIAIKKVLGIKKSVKHSFIIGYLGINIIRTITNMINKIFYKRGEQLSEIEEKERRNMQFWNYIIGGIRASINEVYYLTSNKWWHKLGYPYRCKSCMQDLSLSHLLLHHKNLVQDKEKELKWLTSTCSDYNFGKAVTSLNINKTDAREWVNKAIINALQLKQIAITQLAVKNIFLVTKVRKDIPGENRK